MMKGQFCFRRTCVIMLSWVVILMMAAPVWGAERTTVNMWSASLPGDYNRWVTSEFPRLVEEAFPDLRVEVTIVQSRQELEEKRTIAAAAGVGPDIFHEADNFVQQAAINGTALSLERYLSEWAERDDLIVSDAFKYRGEVYAVPYTVRMTGLAYWQDMLDAAGVQPPNDWDELLSAARHLTVHSNEPGVLEQGGLGTWNNATYDGIYPLQVFVEQLGSSLYSEDLRRPAFNTDEASRALNYAKEMYEVAYPAGARPQSGFTSRGTAMQFWFSTGHTPSIVESYDPEVVKNVRIAKIPGPTGPAEALGIASGWGWAINPDSPRPDDAWRIIEFFVSEEIQSRFLASFPPGSHLSSRRSFEYSRDTPFIDDSMQLAVPPITSWGPVHPLFGDVIRIVEPLIYEAVRGERGVGSALEEAQRLLGNFLEEADW